MSVFVEGLIGDFTKTLPLMPKCKKNVRIKKKIGNFNINLLCKENNMKIFHRKHDSAFIFCNLQLKHHVKGVTI